MTMTFISLPRHIQIPVYWCYRTLKRSESKLTFCGLLPLCFVHNIESCSKEPVEQCAYDATTLSQDHVGECWLE
jgi:hypothetical protein